jgi:integrase
MQSKERKQGKVGLTARGNGIQFGLPRSWFPEGTEQIRFMLGLRNDEDGWLKAEKIARDIEYDFFHKKLPETVEGIKTKYKPQSHLTVIESLVPKPQVSLKELCEQYFAYKSPNASPKTIHTVYNGTLRIISKCPTDGLSDPLKFRMELMQATSEGYVRKTLIQLSAACKWGMKHKLCNENPFDGMYKDFELPKPKPPIAFTVEERDRIIQAFKDHKGNLTKRGYVGFKYSYYAPLIEFLFLTGCRPCEAIGLRWRSVASNFSKIHFHESIVEINGKLVQRDEDKTGAKRWFPCPQKLQSLLQSIKPESCDPDSLVFPAIKDKTKAINESNLNQGAWETILKQINLLYKEVDDHPEPIKMTLYNCRDTFITLQAEQGISTDVIARWVGNSASVIEKKYLDKAKLDHLKPKDI